MKIINPSIKVRCKYDELILIEDIQPHPDNENRHPYEQIRVLSNIIKKDGITHPIVVSSLSGKIMMGHGRLEAFKMLQMTEAPVVFMTVDNPIQELRIRTADNNIQQYSEFDQTAFEINLENYNFSMDDLEMEEFGIIDLNFESEEEEIEEINKGDENSEWFEVPEFKEGEKYIKLLIHFKEEIDRINFIKEKNIEIHSKKSDTWISKQ